MTSSKQSGPRMILDVTHLQELLAKALKRVDHPSKCGVVVEGSIAEGFGNHTSDVDFLLVTEGDYGHPTMPTVLFVDGHRVEVRMRSASQLREQIERVNRAGATGSQQRERLTEDQLNRCQRFAHAVTVQNQSLINRVRRTLPECDLEDLVSSWFLRQARESARYAVALLALGQTDEAALWARTAMLQAGKSWAARQGETYLGLKWVSEQLKRITNHPELLARFRSLASSAGTRPAASDHANACLRMATELGLTEAQVQPDKVLLARRRDVTTWQIGKRVHIVRQQRDVFALTPEAESVWRSLVFEFPLPTILDRASPVAPAAGAVLADFHRLGLIDLRWRGGPRIKGSIAYTPAPAFEQPTLSAHGLLPRPSDRAIKPSPIPAPQFAAAGMAQVWANVEIENAREDMEGALKAEQWGVVRATAYRMIRRACVVTQTAYGIHPLPLPDAGPYRIQDIRDLPPEIKNTALTLEADIQSGPLDEKLDDSTLQLLDQFIEMIRRNTYGEDFPSCFIDDDGWNRTLEIGYDWVRLGAYLDADFPIEEARDLLAAGGQQPVMREVVDARS